MALYYTNDDEGRYFPDRFVVEVCISKKEYYTEYFTDLQSVYEWLEEICDMQVQSKLDVDAIVGQWRKNTHMPTAISTSTKFPINWIYY